MRKCNWIVVILAVVIWAIIPRGVARAQSFSSYVNCSTGAPPYTPATVAPNSSQEVQAFCNPGDVALGGGYEVLNPPLPLPKGVLVITPENSFHFANTIADGWQVVLQNINLSPLCLFPFKGDHSPSTLTNHCPSVDFRVCVSCVTPPAPPT
jgi:hypothetical protein